MRKRRLPKLRNNKSRNPAFVEVDGRRVYLGPWGAPETDVKYDLFIQEFLAAGRRLPRTADEITVVELIARYWAWAKLRYRNKDGEPTSEQYAVKCALRELKSLYGSLAAAAFGPAKLATIQQHLLDKGLHTRTVGHYLSRVRRMFRWATIKELFPADRLVALEAGSGKGERMFCERCAGEGTCDGCKAREKKVTKRAGIVDGERFEAVLSRVTPLMGDVLKLLRYTGMRPAEVTYMRPCDVDRAKDVWVYSVPSHKNEHRGHLRTVAVGPKAQAVLAPRLLGQKDEDRVFPIDRHSINRAVRRACEDADIERWVPKQLRSTRGQEVRDQHGLGTDSAVLGHRTTSTTEKHYTSPAFKAAIDAALASG